MQGEEHFQDSVQVGPTIPPFAEPTWVRPVISSDYSLGKKVAGGWVAARFYDVVTRGVDDGYRVTRLSEEKLLDVSSDRNLAASTLDNFYADRPAFAGLKMNTPHIMGVINVTPDSFSDGGVHLAPAAAIRNGMELWNAGASIIDIGGESTRPGAGDVTRNQELARVLPPISGLSRQPMQLSIDTRHGDVMKRACAAGATIINDVEALQRDGALAAAVACGVPVILMHMQGQPNTMQDEPVYGFAPIDIYEFFEQRLAALMRAGFSKSQIAVDPGFGFGKTTKHNLQILNWLGLFHGLGVPILFGASRKSTIAKLSKGEPAVKRLPGSLVLAMAAFRQGAQILRVHDVAETKQALVIEQAIVQHNN